MVGFLAYLLNVNAYWQPSVEAGKRVADLILSLQRKLIAETTEDAPMATLIARLRRRA
jgi:glucose-6-phosphate isomerase